ncbi:HAD family hydrolase [Patescibacteria group bacterium]|nr:HAD family hydrolase [Patescibacteria group bacterium]
MNASLSQIDFSRIQVVSYDLGYTLLGINAPVIARLVEEHLHLSFTPAQVLRADQELRLQYLHRHIMNTRVQHSHFSAVLCDMIAYLSPEIVTSTPESQIRNFELACRKHHNDHNFFDQIYHDAFAALEALRLAKKRIIAISNAHGTLERDLTKFGMIEYFERILDSTVEGVVKPNPEIFIRAADRCGVPAEAILHIGDNYSADVEGARAVGMQSALYDPNNMYKNFGKNIPSFRNHMDIVDLLLAS